MPRKTKTTAAADKAAQPQFSAAALEQLIGGADKNLDYQEVVHVFLRRSNPSC